MPAYDLNRLAIEITPDRLAPVWDLVGSDRGRGQVQSLLATDANLAISRYLVMSGADVAIARCLTEPEIGERLARLLIGDDAGLPLVQHLAGLVCTLVVASSLVEDDAGGALIREVVNGLEGDARVREGARKGFGAELLPLAGSATGLTYLARSSTQSEVERGLALKLAEQDVGVAMARDLDGLALAMDVIRSDAGWTTARELVRNSNGTTGRRSGPSRTTDGRLFTNDLVASSAGRSLIQSLIRDQQFVPGGLVLKEIQSSLDDGTRLWLARALAASDAGRAFAIELAQSDAGTGLAQALVGSATGRALGTDLTQTGASDGKDQVFLVAAGVGLMSTVPLAALLCAIPQATAIIVLFVAAALAMRRRPRFWRG